jgi:diguanylate cyclase (GGDEF)-like protein
MEMDQQDETAGQSDTGPRALAVQAVTECAIHAVREMDSVGYFNPGCLGVLLPGAELASAIEVAERTRETIARFEPPATDVPLGITVSIGVVGATYRDDSVTLLKRAEAALDAAHRRGGNRIYHHDGERCVPITALVEAVQYLA